MFKLWCPFGNREPTGSDLVKPNVIVAPCIGVDTKGYRLGRGGGFYDRFISQHKNEKLVTIILAYSYQVCDQLPIESHDEPGNIVITEKGVTRFI